MMNRFGMWLWQACPLYKACHMNDACGFETWWRGIIVGEIGVGVLWRTPKASPSAAPKESNDV